MTGPQEQLSEIPVCPRGWGVRPGAVCSSRYRAKVRAWFNFCSLLCHDKLSNLAKRRYVLKIEALKVPFPTGSQDINNSVWAVGLENGYSFLGNMTLAQEERQKQYWFLQNSQMKGLDRSQHNHDFHLEVGEVWHCPKGTCQNLWHFDCHSWRRVRTAQWRDTRVFLHILQRTKQSLPIKEQRSSLYGWYLLRNPDLRGKLN